MSLQNSIFAYKFSGIRAWKKESIFFQILYDSPIQYFPNFFAIIPRTLGSPFGLFGQLLLVQICLLKTAR